MRTAPIIAGIVLLLGGEAVAQAAPPLITLPPVEVIGASPLIGSGIDRNTVPAETLHVRHDTGNAARRRPLVARICDRLLIATPGKQPAQADGSLR